MCGPERVLAEEVIATARAAADERITLVAGDDREADIWAQAGQPAADPDITRLVVIRCAQRLKSWNGMSGLVAATETGLRVLFHSEDRDFPTVTSDGDKSLAPHVALLRDSSKGLIIRAIRPSGEEELAEWAAQRLGGAGRVLGSRALLRAGGDLRSVADLGDKLARAGFEATQARVDVLCEQQPGEEFATLLVLGDKPGALAAAPGEPPARAISLLTVRLHTLAALHAAHQRHLDARDTARQFGVDQYAQRLLRDVAPSYSPPKVASCRSVLAAADDAWRGGESAGVLEFVTALW